MWGQMKGVKVLVCVLYVTGYDLLSGGRLPCPGEVGWCRTFGWMRSQEASDCYVLDPANITLDSSILIYHCNRYLRDTQPTSLFV